MKDMQAIISSNPSGETKGLNPFYLTAGLYLLVDAMVLLTLALVMVDVLPSISGATWVRVHLLTIGVVTQLVLGALPLFLDDGRTTDAPYHGWWFSVISLNLGVTVIWLAAFLPAWAVGLTALGFALVFVGWLPPLVHLLPRLFSYSQAPS